MITNKEQEITLNNLNNLKEEFKNYFNKIKDLANKSEELNKTLDFQVNSKLNL